MNKQEKMGEDIRILNGQSTGTMTELVFNPLNGEFETRPQGSSLGTGELNVTEMSEEGFASNVGMMTEERFAIEKKVLERYQPSNTYVFKDLPTNNPYVLMAARTNNKNVYTLRIDLKDFPNNVPKAFVTKMLKDKSGANMDYTSGGMHTLSSEYGYTRICHYSGSAWGPNVSLYKVYIKCCIWLEMYELHLKTGNNIDYYLKHQS